MHVETHIPTWKAFLFLEDVSMKNGKGPFHYVPGSHKVDLKKYAWLYQRTKHVVPVISGVNESE